MCVRACVCHTCVTVLHSLIISLSIMQSLVIIGFHHLINNKSIASIGSESSDTLEPTRCSSSTLTHTSCYKLLLTSDL